MPAPKDPKKKLEWLDRLSIAGIGNINHRKGSKLSEESKKKISLSLLGNKYALGSHSRQGIPQSDETKAKISKANKGKTPRLGVKLTDETKKKISEAHKGKHLTEETRRKLSQSLIGNQWNKGKHLTEETKKKISEANKGKIVSEERKQKLSQTNKTKVGSLGYNWKGGISEDHRRYWSERRARELHAPGSHTIGEWETLKAQYDWRCLSCGKKEPEIKLTEDHIIPLTKGGSNNIENIQPLCQSCNSRKHTKIINYREEMIINV